jgi:hypothetical protein
MTYGEGSSNHPGEYASPPFQGGAGGGSTFHLEKLRRKKPGAGISLAETCETKIPTFFVGIFVTVV